MKLFKKLLLLLMLPSVTAFGGPMVKKEQAKRIIRRTAVVILAVHKKVKEGKVYTGNLAKAIAHQKFAIKLYREGKYFRAIHHSRRAKFLALMAIKANKGAETSEMKYQKEDENAFKGGPSDDELDKELAKEMPAEAAAKDEEAVTAEPAVDLTDNE
jgi:hypothetical protein